MRDITRLAAALTVAAAMASVSGWAQAQDIAGDWHATAQSGGVRIGITFTPKAGGYDGVFGSPDNPSVSLALSDVKVEGGVLSFTIPQAGASFTGRWDDQRKAWVGEFGAGAAKQPLVLTAGKPEARAAGTPGPDLPPIALYQTPHLVALPSGRRINLVCMGEGSPTVVLEDGLGGSLWPVLQYKIARTTRTCSYSRAGAGFSDEGPAPRDATAIAADLDALLRAAPEKGPYVLVGHSAGGYFVRLFADLHPKEVVGMVLLDPSIDDMLPRMAATAPSLAKAGVDGGVDTLAKCAAAADAGELKPGADVFKTCGPGPAGGWPKMYHFVRAEAESLARDSDEAKAHRRSYGDMPLVVLTAGNQDPTMTEAEKQAWAKVWMKGHDDIAALSSHGQNRVVQGSGHNMQIEKPQVVIDTVNEVVAEARKRLTTH